MSFICLPIQGKLPRRIDVIIEESIEASSFRTKKKKMSFEGKKTWIDLEQALMQDLGMLEDEEDTNDTESSRNSDDGHDNASPCHDRSTPPMISREEDDVDLEVQNQTAEESDSINDVETIPHDDVENAFVVNTNSEGGGTIYKI